MTEFEIITIADLIKDKNAWECGCRGCKHLGDVEWHFAGRNGKTYRCTHPDRQGGFSDPRPHGCQGYRFEKKEG